jgi:hypothetical protein
VRIDTPQEVTAQYYGDFRAGKLVFPLKDEVYTLGGEKAQAVSGIAWAVAAGIVHLLEFCGDRSSGEPHS